MRKILFFLFVCWGTIGMGVAQEQVKISRFQGERVTGLDISGAFDITIRQGEDTGVTLSIPSHYEDNLVFENWGGTVKVGFKGRIKKHAKNEKFTAEIVCSSLEEVLLSGACKLKGTGDFTAQTVKFDLSGAATAVWDGNFKVVKSGKIDLSAASQLQLNVEVPEVEVEISGAAKLALTGEADSGEIELSGASKANLENFVLKNLALATSGASNASVNVTETLGVEASGAAHVSYSGNPKVTSHVSGAASLKQR